MWATTLVVLLTLLAAWLRFTGIGYLLPEVKNPDGSDILMQVALFQGRSDEALNFWYSSYPHLFARIAALWPVSALQPGETASLERHLDLASAPWIAARMVSVIASLLAIPATYWLARRFLGRTGALFAAGLIATSLLHIVNAIQEKPHAAATSLAVLALLAALRLRRRPDVASYWLCGLCAALAVGMLHNASLCLPALAVAWLRRDRSAARTSGWWILVPVAFVGASIALFYPFFLAPLDLPAPAAQAITAAGFSHFVAETVRGFRGAPITLLFQSLLRSDPWLVGLALAGVLVWIGGAVRDRERSRGALRGDLAVVLAYTLPYLFVLGLYQSTLVRFFLPLMPVFACAAGRAFEQISAACFTGRHRALGRGALGVLLVVWSAWPVAHFARIRCAPSPLDEAASWIAEHVPPTEVVVVLPLCEVPLTLTRAAIAENTRVPNATIWSSYLARTQQQSTAAPGWTILVQPGAWPQSRIELVQDPLAYLRRWNARYVVIDLVGGGENLLADKATRVARFSPLHVDDGAGRGLLLWGTGYDGLRASALSVLGMRSLGTTVEIYRLP